jgi:transposase-like protein
VSKKVIRYSEAFKQQVVSELEDARFGSPFEASKAYGITGSGTVRRWVKENGKGHLLRKVVRVEKQGEPGEIKRLKERVRQLEASLADAHMDWALEKSYFKILCERTDTDVEAFKKKHGGMRSTRRGK